MPFVAQKHQVAFYPVPKCGSSTVKKAMAQAVGWKVDPAFNIHGYFPTEAFHRIEGIFYRFTVVRDPLSRLVSFYNMMMDGNWLGDWIPKNDPGALAQGLPTAPTFDFFINHLADYQKAFWVRDHTRPISFFIGNDLTYFDKVFRLFELPELEKVLNDKFGTMIKFGREEASSGLLRRSSITKKTKDKAIAFCESDYSLLRDYFKAGD